MTLNYLTALIIAKGYTLDEGLRAIGKSKRTYYRWIGDDVKRKELKALIDDLPNITEQLGDI